MQLSELMPTATKLQLEHPTKGKLDLFLDVVGQDSKSYRNKSKELMKTRLLNKEKTMDVDQVERDNAALAAACITGWNDEEAFGEYSEQRAIELMLMPELSWIREGVERFVTERSHFFRGSEITVKGSDKKDD